MAHIIVTGATGAAGSAVLAHALASPSISRVSILSRRPVKLAENQPKANVIIHQDFESYPPSVLDQLKGAQGVVWAQGISSYGMKEDEYSLITVTYPVAAAKAFAGLNDKLNFVYVSGEGADTSGKAYAMFGRVKGRAEKTLLELQNDHEGLSVYNVRPAVIRSVAHLADRSKNMNDRLIAALGPVFQMVMPSFVIPTDKLAEATVKLAIGDGKPVPAGVGVEADGRLLRNTALRKLAGL